MDERNGEKNYIDNTKSYMPTYFGKGTPTLDPIREFAHYFDPNQPGAQSDCDSEDMEEEVEYMTDDEEVMSEQEESNHGYTQNIQHFEEKDDVDEWLNAEITKHMKMKDGIMKRQFEASIASVSDEVSSIASNEVDIADDNTPNTTPYAKDNFMPQRVYEYLGLDKLRDTSTLENTTGTNENLGTVNILVKFRELEFPCNFIIKIVEDVIILGRPFLESTRAQIDVFNEEISFEIGRIDLFSYESPACLEFEQRTRSYGTPNPRDEIAKPISFSPDRRGSVKRWHICKPVHVTYDDGNGEDCGMWPTCDHDSKFCFGYNEVFGVNEHGTLRLWICQQNYKKTNEAWHDEAYEEDEMWQIGDKKTDYDPPYFYVKTFEAKKYYFKGGHSFICITDRKDEALPLGRVNGARFKAMIRKELEGHKTKELDSLRVKPSTSASESQPLGNTKKDKIQQTPSSTQKNKVEAHPRTAKSSLKNKNCVEPKGYANEQNSKLNANSKILCVKCNGCVLSDNHDLCVLDFINNMNARAKSKSVKKRSKRKVWKPTGKVFTNIGYTWRPTGRTFTIVGNECPLTRITTTAKVPFRKPTALESDTLKPVVTLVYSRKPRKSKTNVPIGNVTISRVYYVEGLGHKLFSVGENLGKLQPKADIGIFIGYAPTKKAFQIYNRRTRRIIETIHVDFDELTAMASEHSSLEPALHEMTPATISSGLVPNPPPSTPFVPPSRTDWDLLFQPLFDELLNPPSSVDRPAPEVIAPIAEVVAPEPAASTGSPSSTTVDQDAPSPSNSQTTPETQSPD
ncbi:integrase, catalytic region, zinc finger, CCHC-type containing protein [Tanacetum coccineum]